MNTFALDSALDVAALSRAFARDGRLQIRNFLADRNAEALAGLHTDFDWRLGLNNSGRHVDLTRAEIEQAGAERMSAIFGEVGKRATAGFHYLYENYPFTDLEAAGQLQFLDAKHSAVIESYVPAVNSLSVLGVPQPHHVSQVASFASMDRVSLTGWYRLRS